MATRSAFCRSLERRWPLCRAPFESSVCRCPGHPLGHRAGAARGLWQPRAGSSGLFGSLRFTDCRISGRGSTLSAGPILQWSTHGVSHPAAPRVSRRLQLLTTSPAAADVVWVLKECVHGADSAC